jgi:hypothetical protein
MKVSKRCWQVVCVAAVLASLGFADLGSAQDKGQKEPKKGKSEIIQVDLSKLPPDLARQVLEFSRSQAKGGDKKKDGKDNRDEGNQNDRDDGNKNQQGFQGEQTGQHEDGKGDSKAKTKGKDKEKEQASTKKKSQPETDSSTATKRQAELEQRLDRLIEELNALRKEIRKK